jgi:putative Mg2+ transporter-C (MgtC) family protein
MVITNHDIIMRLLIALIVGGLTGLERERSHQFAGFRTHILVSVGSCITSITSLSLFFQYNSYSNIDPARLSAQVLSGVGFLGAGTIIRNGSTVKGLTTAATIWAVACIGLATGIGFYAGALVSTFVILLILAYLKTFVASAYDHTVSCQLNMKLLHSPELINTIEDKFSSKTITINNIRFRTDKDNVTEVTYHLSIQ